MPGQTLKVPGIWGYRISRQSGQKLSRFISPKHQSPLPHSKYSRYAISVRGWVYPSPTVRPEGLCQWQIPMTPSGIQTATFRLVVQRLNRLRYEVINCTRRKEMSSLSTTKYTLLCSQGLPVPSVLRSMSAGHTLTFHFFKIHINIFVPSTRIYSKLFLRFRYSG